jgi:hypothetical protein
VGKSDSLGLHGGKRIGLHQLDGCPAFQVCPSSKSLVFGPLTSDSTATPLIRTINDTNIPSKQYYAYATFGRYARPGSERVYAESSASNLSVSAFTSIDGFASGGNLAIQTINNGDKFETTPANIQSIEGIIGIAAYLVNNDFDLAEKASLVEFQGTDVTVTVPTRSLIVLAVNGSWGDDVSNQRAERYCVY